MAKQLTHRKWLLAAVSFSAALLLVEFALRLFTIFPVHGEMSNRLPDDVLGYRMDPSLGDIDDSGFRNDAVLSQADIVAIGDSHTYGNNVASENSWPRRLGALAGMSVYNLGVGGYGPLQYHHLMKRAIELAPKHIVLGLYLPNDLHDACALVKGVDYWQTWARQRGHDPARCASAAALDDDGSGQYFGKRLVTRTAVGSFLTHVVEEVSERRLIAGRSAEATRQAPKGVVVLSDGRNDTMITHRRLANQGRSMDLREEYVSAGFLITKDVIREAQSVAAANAATLTVLVVPSKGSVFFEHFLARGHTLPPEYYQYVRNEEHLVTELLNFCDGIALRCIVAKPYVVRELDRTTSVYPPTGDGHPLEPGYLAYAKAAFDGMFSSAGISEERALVVPGR